MSDILAGYQLHITSYENDGDNYQTKIISSLSKADLLFYIDLANQFKGDLGNDDVDEAIIVSTVNDCIARHSDMSIELATNWTELCSDPGSLYWELNNNVIGSPSEYYDYCFCRRVEAINVYSVPLDIIDVTNSFSQYIQVV